MQPSATARPRVWGRGGVPAPRTPPKGVGGTQSPIFWSSPPEVARDFFPRAPHRSSRERRSKEVFTQPAGRGWKGTGLGAKRAAPRGDGALIPFLILSSPYYHCICLKNPLTLFARGLGILSPLSSTSSLSCPVALAAFYLLRASASGHSRLSFLFAGRYDGLKLHRKNTPTNKSIPTQAPFPTRTTPLTTLLCPRTTFSLPRTEATL